MTGKAQNEQQDMATESSGRNTIVLLIAALFLLALLSFAYLQLSKAENLPIAQVKISGSFENIKPEMLKKIINQDIQGNFFTLDVGRLYARLIAMEWAQQVWIHRVWPDTLSIDLKEHSPVAFVDNKGLMNAQGEIFARHTGVYENRLPKFLVTERYYLQAIEAYRQLTASLEKYELEIKEFVFDERKSQSIKLENGIQIVLGRHHTEERFARFINTFAEEMQQRKNQIKRIDLRYTNGFSVSNNSLFRQIATAEVFWA